LKYIDPIFTSVVQTICIKIEEELNKHQTDIRHALNLATFLNILLLVRKLLLENHYGEIISTIRSDISKYSDEDTSDRNDDCVEKNSKKYSKNITNRSNLSFMTIMNFAENLTFSRYYGKSPIKSDLI
jgi:hypothetical protein